jgi:chromate transporter
MAPQAEPLRLSAAALFVAFFRAGLMGFGGVLPMIRRVMVEDRRWQTPAEFNELLALCQFLPGA